jgi:hypothetical protein
MQTALGEIVPALRTPEGALAPDRVERTYHCPDWATDPFRRSETLEDQPDPEELIAGRYLVVSTIYASPRSAVHLAIDTTELRRCVLKRTRGGGDDTGIPHMDSHALLQHESDMLTRLAHPRIPRMYQLFDHGGDRWLAMEDLEGETLARSVGRRAALGVLLSEAQLVSWARQLTSVLGDIHAKGFVYRDLKSTNIIVAPDDQLYLVDFELAGRLGHTNPVGTGTPGYASPQQHAGEAPAIADDIYGLGALLYFTATGAEPSTAPRPSMLLDRPIELMNPGVSRPLRAVIRRCLDPDPAARFPSAHALDDAFAALEAADQTAEPRSTDADATDEESSRVRYREIARRLADGLCDWLRAMQSAEEPREAVLRSLAHAHGYLDLGHGYAGAVMALAELVRELRSPDHARVLEASARWLCRAEPLEGPPLPGLYVGQAGIALAILKAGQVLADDTLIQLAAERGRWIATLPYTSPDLYHGTAGRLRFHLLAWALTRDGDQLTHAEHAGDVLVRSAEAAGDGMAKWTIPEGYGSLSGLAHLGYAHGAAGIADSLLDLHDVTEDRRLIEVTRCAGNWLRANAQSLLPDDSGWNWPAIEHGRLVGPFWCHGAAGIGRFFLTAARKGVIEDAALIVARAAQAVTRAGRHIGPSACHGLAGSIEFLIDLAGVSGGDAYLREARALARLLEAFVPSFRGQDGHESPLLGLTSPAYMTGAGGAALCFLRLSGPHRVPHAIAFRNGH